MREREFIAESRDAWERLSASVRQSRHGSSASRNADAVRRMHEDYRRTAADLAYAQTHFPDSRITTRLNRLVAMAHAELYGSAPRRFGSLLHFVVSGWPSLIRRNWRPLLLAVVMLFGAGAMGYVLSFVNYPLARLFLPELFRDGIGDAVERGRDLPAIAATAAPLLTAGITANNIQAALTAFAGGMTLGALTTFSLVANGLLLGTLAGVFAKAGHSAFFWSLIIPHGALELPAIALAGCGGLMLAGALILPGDLPRTTALTRVAPDAARVVLGAVPLLMVAGIIEGFLTPTAIDPAAKIAFGVATAIALVAYIVLAGRAGDPSGRSAAER